jgi:HSP20 family molecular chaperone IbpA
VIQWTSARAVQAVWRPPADVYETPTRVSVTIELAGIEPAEVHVLCFERTVVVEGRRRMPALEPRPAASDGLVSPQIGEVQMKSGKR